MIPTLSTSRLRLRPLRPGDASSVTTALNDWDVIRWLSGPPYPFQQSDARAFIDEALETEAPVWAIAAPKSRLIGVIGLGEEFGYWLRRSAWGRGFASEAAGAVLHWHFGDRGSPVWSGIHPDNARSRRVLEKLGFAAAGESVTYFASRQAEIARAMYRLEAEAWAGLRAASE